METNSLSGDVTIDRVKQLSWRVESAPSPAQPTANIYTITCDELPGLVHSGAELESCLRGAFEGARQFIEVFGIVPKVGAAESAASRQRRVGQINVKLSKEEIDLIRGAVEATGGTISAFVRKAAVDAARARPSVATSGKGSAIGSLRAVVNAAVPKEA